MAQSMVISLHACSCCKLFEAKPLILKMEMTLSIEPMDQVQINYVNIKFTARVKEKLVVKNMLVV